MLLIKINHYYFFFHLSTHINPNPSPFGTWSLAHFQHLSLPSSQMSWATSPTWAPPRIHPWRTRRKKSCLATTPLLWRSKMAFLRSNHPRTLMKTPWPGHPPSRRRRESSSLRPRRLRDHRRQVPRRRPLMMWKKRKLEVLRKRRKSAALMVTRRCRRRRMSAQESKFAILYLQVWAFQFVLLFSAGSVFLSGVSDQTRKTSTNKRRSYICYTFFLSWYPLTWSEIEKGSRSRIIYHIIYHIISYHIISYHIISYHNFHFYPSARIGLEGYCRRLPGGQALPHTVTALPGAVLIGSRSNLVGTILGAGSRTSSFMGDVAG